MDEDTYIRDELERLAHAHLVAECAPGIDTNDDAPLALSAEIAATLRSALHASLTGASKDMTAIVSVPASTPLPADWLFKLEAPVESPAQLEAALGLQSGMLKSVKATRSEGDDRGAEQAEFAFVTENVKGRIETLVKEGNLEVTPLFVKVTRTGADRPGI